MSEQKTTPIIYFVEPPIKLPGPGCPAGQTTKGSFTFEDSTVVLCHPDSPTPVRDPSSGKTYTRKLDPPTNTLLDAHQHAELLTLEFRKALSGGRPKGFGGRGPIGGPKGPLNYPGGGWM
jgi:hypothetical protein